MGLIRLSDRQPVGNLKSEVLGWKWSEPLNPGWKPGWSV